MKPDHFISIALEENSIQAAIWNIKDNAANVISVSNPVTYEDDETLVSAGDECLSSCIQNLPEDIEEPSKTVFGVPSFWVKDGQIEREFLDKIRTLCNKLSLKPTGFVVLPEAIAHLKKSETETPVTGIFIGVYGQSIDVSLFRLGNLVGTVNVARSVNITDDVVEGLARFNTDTLPSQLLLYDARSHDLEDIKQELIKADWNNLNDKIKFLHTPSVSILNADAKMSAISLAGAAEMANLTKVNYDKPASEEGNKEKKEEEVHENEVQDEFVNPESLGFSVGKDIESGVANLENVSQREIKKITKLKMPGLKINFPSKFKFKMNENFAFLAVVGVLVLALLGLVAFWFLPKADVSIFVSPVKIDEQKKVKFDTSAQSVDVSKLIVPVKEVSTTVSGDKTKTATGTTVIGSPAKGSVTFYNVGGSTTIPAGTVLTSSDLNFTLDSDVQVASASGAASASSAKGNITAQGVGANYNLASGSIFSVGDYSQSLIQAKNDADLSGGSSQEVTAVSKSDIDSLTSDLKSKLTDEGKNNLKQNLSPGEIFMDSTVSAQVVSSNSDHEVGDQASTVKLSLSLKISSLVVSRDDMNNLAKSLFADKVKSDLTLKDDQIDFIFGKDNVEFKINLLPTLDLSQVASSITGKNEATARNILSNIPGFTDAQFIFKPNISFLKILPHVAKNIQVTLSAK